jgi:isoquinoline 1-oxidoreductase subunit alpha
LLKDKPKPSEADIDEAITNICRCGTYNRVKVAILQAAGVAPQRSAGTTVIHIAAAAQGSAT